VLTNRIARVIRRLPKLVQRQPTKYQEEVAFWRSQIAEYLPWYHAEMPERWGTASPRAEEKIIVHSEAHSALLTWLKKHQQQKYLYDLQLHTNTFSGERLLDVGAGPLPSATVFAGAELYCLDPLYPQYLESGYPLHYYPNVRFVHAYAEAMPIEDHFFDAVISVNAIDHVDDFFRTAQEIKRVLKPAGRLRMHVHYHQKTITEPIELNDAIMQAAYGWCEGFCKIDESQSKMDWTLPAGESYALWSNFE